MSKQTKPLKLNDATLISHIDKQEVSKPGDWLLATSSALTIDFPKTRKTLTIKAGHVQLMRLHITPDVLWITNFIN